MNEKEIQYTEELEEIIYQYSRSKKAEVTATILLLAAMSFFSSFWGAVFISIVGILGGYLFTMLGGTFTRPAVPAKKLAYNARSIMDSMIYGSDHGWENSEKVRYVLPNYFGKHPELYKMFISRYPSLASWKLKRLAKINVSFKDIQ